LSVPLTAALLDVEPVAGAEVVPPDAGGVDVDEEHAARATATIATALPAVSCFPPRIRISGFSLVDFYRFRRRG
jgi:hypothetical protein